MSASPTRQPPAARTDGAHHERPLRALRRAAGPLAALLTALLAVLAPAGAGAQNLPEVSVSLVGGVWTSPGGTTYPVPIREGNDIRFALTRTGASTATLLGVDLEVTHNGSRQTRTATFPAGEQTVHVTVPTVENEVVDAAHHSLTVTIQPAARYQVSAESGTVSVVVPDDDAFEEDETLTVRGAATGLKVAGATATRADDDVETLLQAVNRNGTATDATTVRGVLIMRVLFQGAATVTGFTQDDIVLTGGAITDFRREIISGTVVHFVWVAVAEDAETVTFVVPENVIDEGNSRAEATYTVAPPLTITLTSDATAPVQGNFDVFVTFSAPVDFGGAHTESTENVFIVVDDVEVAHGRLLSHQMLSTTRWRITIGPDGGFYGTLRVTIPKDVAALADDEHTLNQAAEFEILVDTVFDDAALASLSLSDPHGSGGVRLDPSFSKDHTEYEAVFGRGVAVRVHAAVRDPGATFVIAPRFGQSDQSAGHDVLLTPGRATEVTVAVTAENRTTQRTYTVRVVNAIVTLAVTPARIGENGGSATVTGTIDPPFGQGAYVTVQAAPVAPAASTDFIVSDRTWLYFPANATASTGTVTITAVNDDRLTPDKEVRVNGTTLAAGVPVVATTLTIEDDDRSVTLTLSPDTVAEDGGAQTVTVTAALGAQASSRDTPIEVTVSVAAGTATEGTDFTAVADFRVEIPANQRSGSGTFTLSARDDGAFEGDETLTVSGAASGLEVTAATLTLAEDDLPWVTMETAATSVAEDGSVTFTLTREGSRTAPLAIPGSLLRSHHQPAYPAGTSVVYRQHPVTFAAGSATTTLTVAPDDDGLFFTYRLLNVDLQTGTAGLFRLRVPASAGDLSDATRTSYQLRIDDDDPVRVSIVQQNPQSLVYEEDPACFVVSSDAVFNDLRTEQVSLTLAVSQQGDYLAAAPGNHPVTLSAGSQAHTLCLELDDDKEVEDTGSVTVTLVATDGVVAAASGSVTVTVYDNELPAYTMTTTAASVDEGAGVEFTVSRIGNLEQAVSRTGHVFYRLPAGLRDDGTVFHDFTYPEIFFDAGQSSVTFTAAVPDDDRYFPARDLFVALSATDASSTLPYFELQRPFPDNADPTSGDTALYYRIPVVEDDLPGVWITAAETSVSESEPACFTLGIDGVLLPGSDGPTGLRVDLDVTQQGDSLRGSPGNRTETLDSLPHTMCLELRDDDVGEEDGAVTVTITPADDRYRIGDPGSASVTVKDNDWRQMVGWDPLAPPDELTERSYWPLGASTSLSVWEGNSFCGYLQRWLVDPRGYYRTSEYHYHGFDLREPLPELTVRLGVQETRDDLLRTPTTTVRFSTAPTGVDRFHVKACYRSVEDDVINSRHFERFRVWIEEDPSYVRLRTPTPDNRSWWHPYLILDLQVQDDDAPRVTLTAEPESVQEGEDVVLTLTRRAGDLVTPVDVFFNIRKKSTNGGYLGPHSGFVAKWYVCPSAAT